VIVLSGLICGNAKGSLSVGGNMDLREGVTPCHSLVVQATLSRIVIRVTPADASGAGDGRTVFQRQYSQGTELSLSSPTLVSRSGARYDFVKWQVDGADAGTNLTLEVTMDKDHVATAVFRAR